MHNCLDDGTCETELKASKCILIAFQWTTRYASRRNSSDSAEARSMTLARGVPAFDGNVDDGSCGDFGIPPMV